MLRFSCECSIREHRILCRLSSLLEVFQLQLIGWFIPLWNLTIVEIWVKVCMLTDNCCGRYILWIVLVEFEIIAWWWPFVWLQLHVTLFISPSTIALNRYGTICLIHQLSMLGLAVGWLMDLHCLIPVIFCVLTHCLFLLEESVHVISASLWCMNSQRSVFGCHHQKVLLQLSCA